MNNATLWKTTLVSAIALLFAACSNAAGPHAATGRAQRAVHSGAAQTVAAGNSTPANQGSVEAALKAVVQQGNDAQQQALSLHNPAVMHTSATDDYYQQMVQTNDGLVNGGVTSIKLVKLAWGPLTVNGSSAQVTTDETWRTTYADGTSDQTTDRNVYSLVKQGTTWKIQDDAHPNSSPNLSSPGQSSPSAPPTGQQPGGQGTPRDQGQSQNWSGYEADGGNFTTVSGTWTIPQRSGTGSPGADASWVGIGGVSGHDLIQAGTEATVDGSGQVSYQAWVETLPQASQPVSLRVGAGDSVTVSISEQSPDQWLLELKNNTSGQSYHVTEQYASTHSSAEWVEEAPSGRRQVLPLDNFGTVHFSNGSAVKDGKTVNLAQTNAQPITMIDPYGQAMATPSALGSDGKSFSVSVTNTGTSGQANPRSGGFQITPGGRGAGRSPVGRANGFGQ